MSRIVCGIQPVREAIRAHGARLERVLVQAGDAPQLEAVARFARDRGAIVERAPRGALDALAEGARHQGVVAVAPDLQLHAIEDVGNLPDEVIIALDELQDPQNFGAVIRSAVGMGASTVLWPEHSSAPLTPATFRASAGAIEHARLCRVRSLPNALEALRARGCTVVGLDASGDRAIYEVDLRSTVVLVVGAEGKGLRGVIKRVCDVLARLPMGGPVGSLNASVSAAIALYEAKRQRELGPRFNGMAG